MKRRLTALSPPTAERDLPLHEAEKKKAIGMN
jgi:hypothetical protein